MKTKAQKQQDLNDLTERFKAAKAAMLVGFAKMTRSSAINCAKPVSRMRS